MNGTREANISNCMAKQMNVKRVGIHVLKYKPMNINLEDGKYRLL